jgi:murein DD-endopeptidase MepM/ murein hydrolase activator NlpD
VSTLLLQFTSVPCVASVARVARGKGWAGCLLGALFVAAVVSPSPITSPPAHAATGTDDVSPEEARLLAQIQESTARREELDRKVNDLDRQIANSRAQLYAAEAELVAFETRVQDAEHRLDETRRQLVQAEKSLRDQAIAVYIGATDPGRVADMLLRVDTISAMAAKRAYMRIVVDTQADVVLATEGLRNRTEELIRQAGTTRAKAEAERQEIAARRAELQRERNNQANLRYAVDHELARHNDLLRTMLNRREEFTGAVLELKRQSDALEASLKSRQVSPASATVSGGRLATPIPGARVTSTFGTRVHPVYRTVRSHTGIDLAGATGTPIRAAADGIVLKAGWMGGYGQATVLDHGGPLATLYGHQSQILVKPGEAVSRGEIIGRVGCTGTCTGPHLHYEVRINGTPVNPANYL